MNESNKIEIRILNGFIDNERGGNPAGFVMPADLLTNAEKQKIAALAGLSETAFVSSSEVADFKFDFFTPTKQIPHCGHATIAAFSYMQQSGILHSGVSSKETIDGIRKIILKEGNAFMEQNVPAYISVEEDLPEVLDAMGLKQDDLIGNAEPCIVSTGNSFLIIGVKNNDILKAINYDTEKVYHISEKYNLVGFYPFSTRSVIDGRDATARMFGPFYGIAEESATGMAAGPLACYLYDRLHNKKNRFLIEQGHFMKAPSPSLVIVELDIQNGSIAGLMAGGKGNAERTLTIDY